MPRKSTYLLPQPFPLFLSLKSSVENWFCGREVEGGGGRGAAGARAQRCTLARFCSRRSRSAPEEASVAQNTRPGFPSAGPHGNLQGGPEQSETWAVLLVPALMLPEPAAQGKSLNTEFLIFPSVKNIYIYTSNSNDYIGLWQR